MPKGHRFAIVYAPVTREHIRRIPRRDLGLLRNASEVHLGDEPERETANRRPLAPTTEVEAEWELRCGPHDRLRVFYSVDRQHAQVRVMAMGVKMGSRLKIGREEIGL
jgi:hypothetical protein